MARDNVINEASGSLHIDERPEGDAHPIREKVTASRPVANHTFFVVVPPSDAV